MEENQTSTHTKEELEKKLAEETQQKLNEVKEAQEQNKKVELTPEQREKNTEDFIRSLAEQLDTTQRVIVFIDKVLLKTRKERKIFWREFCKGNPEVRLGAIASILNKYKAYLNERDNERSKKETNS